MLTLEPVHPLRKLYAGIADEPALAYLSGERPHWGVHDEGALKWTTVHYRIGSLRI
jgi:hypothetical protein